jgi:hypothetical protein
MHLYVMGIHTLDILENRLHRNPLYICVCMCVQKKKKKKKSSIPPQLSS